MLLASHCGENGCQGFAYLVFCHIFTSQLIEIIGGNVTYRPSGVWQTEIVKKKILFDLT